MTSQTLPGLPGADADPGTRPAVRSLFGSLLGDDSAVRHAAPPDPSSATVGPGAGVTAGALQRHRAGARAWYRDVRGAIHVPASSTDDVLAGLVATDHAVPLVLTADASGLGGLRQARNMLLEDDRVELLAVHVGLPPDRTPAAGARALLEALDFTAPARVDTGLVPGWHEALDVLAADGAEDVALRLDAAAPGEVAAFLRVAVDLDLTVHCSCGPDQAVTGDGEASVPGLGVINVLCGVRAALNGAEAPEVGTILGATTAAPLTSAVRRMSDADAALVRAFLGSVACADPVSVVDDLVALGLLDPREEG